MFSDCDYPQSSFAEKSDIEFASWVLSCMIVRCKKYGGNAITIRYTVIYSTLCEEYIDFCCPFACYCCCMGFHTDRDATDI